MPTITEQIRVIVEEALTRGWSFNSIVRKAKTSDSPLRNVRAGLDISLRTGQAILEVLGYRLVAVRDDTLSSTPPSHHMGHRGRPMDNGPDPVYEPAIPETKNPRAFDQCCFGCGSVGTIIKVHGHTQCSKCGRVLQSCCDL